MQEQTNRRPPASERQGGPDTGTFEAVYQDGTMIMTSPANAMGLQRVVFSDIKIDSFLWSSDYSQDGKTRTTATRVLATRVATGQ